VDGKRPHVVLEQLDGAHGARCRGRWRRSLVRLGQ
jgi:hypothetical protein